MVKFSIFSTREPGRVTVYHTVFVLTLPSGTSSQWTASHYDMDTEAAVSLAPESVLADLLPSATLQPTTTGLRTYTGETIPVNGTILSSSVCWRAVSEYESSDCMDLAQA